jgi:hypothetical protein
MNTGALILLGVGAYYLLSGNLTSTGKPTFYNMSKQTITTIQCGGSVIFDVPGYTLVWLERTKNGVQDFAGPYAVPTTPYVMSCSTDVGSYTVTVFAINPDGSKGALLGSTPFTVTASA